MSRCGEYSAVLNAVNVIKSFLDKYGAEAGTSYWKSNIDDEILVTDWGYVEEGLGLLKGYCLKLTKGERTNEDTHGRLASRLCTSRRQKRKRIFANRQGATNSRLHTKNKNEW